MNEYLKSSVGRKQIVAVTGLALILFIIGHLAGNLFIFLGPDAYNAYAKKLAGLRPGLYVVEFGLAWIFFVHIWVTATLVLENIKARGERGYSVSKDVGKRSLATRIMPYTGTIIFLFVILHLLDFTFTDHHGPKSLVQGIDLGVYGLVYNSFKNPLHSLWYIVAICCLGFHLTHGIQSFIQTFGYNHPTITPMIKNIGNALALLITILYSSIPVYIFLS